MMKFWKISATLSIGRKQLGSKAHIGCYGNESTQHACFTYQSNTHMFIPITISMKLTI